MNITIVGTGYVGLVTGACFASMGNTVYCIDIDHHKISNLQNGIVPIYEPGLEELVKSNLDSGTLIFSHDLKSALMTSQIVFITVGTPMKEDRRPNLSYVKHVAHNIGEFIVKPIVVVNKSTVPVGTARVVKQVIAATLAARSNTTSFEVVSNPEFLREGAAIQDFMKPDRVIVGAESENGFKVMRELYAPFMRKHNRLIEMDIPSAELTKYAANAILATKISFMNEIANLSEKLGADINHVRIGIGSDPRIGHHFIYPGCGYGGSCFPKDVSALIHMAEDCDIPAKLLTAVHEVNETQKSVLVEKIISHFGTNLSGKKFAIWGLSFKPETDDMREAPSVTVVSKLVALGASVSVYDPKALNEAKSHFQNIPVEYAHSKYDALNQANALLLLTEWKEFRSPDFDEMKRRLQETIIFDGRNQFASDQMQEKKFTYFQIGVPSVSVAPY